VFSEYTGPTVGEYTVYNNYDEDESPVLVEKPQKNLGPTQAPDEPKR